MADLSGRVLGDYLLREKIADGGYGDVYRAEHRLLKRVAVVKVLNEERQRHDHAEERFLREAQLASRLRHPYAAHIYDFGVADEDGLLWIAMELVEGVTLGEWLEKHGPMGLEEFVPFFEDVAEVVHAAHAAGIVHRDLKPSNVMVTERNGRRVPKLLDFGIAKGEVAPLFEDEEPVDASGRNKIVTELIRATPRHVYRTKPAPIRPVARDPAHQRRITGTGAGVGSRPYMAPEQWYNASGVGPPADTYSLGIMVYEALTGRRPFTAESTDEFFRYHCHAPVPALGRGLSPDLDRILSRALAKAPERRHGNVLELAADLRAVLRADPRAQLQSLTRRWHERGRSADLLARGKVLKAIERYVHRVGEAALSDLECSFVVHSRRLARRIRWFLWSLVALAAVIVVGFAAMQLRSARQLAEVTVTQSELAQGRSALLHGETEALPHLAEAYKRGERSKSTKFMFARAAQPRLAEQARFTSTSGRMWSATFSPDGRQIVTTDDKNAQVRDAQTGQLRFTLAHGSEVYEAVYSADGGKVVTAAEDAVRIWDTASGALVHELRQERSDGKPSDYYLAAMSPDGKLVAAIDAAGSAAHVWDAVTGAPLTQLRNDASGFPSIAFSADGHWLATSGGDDVRVFDVETWTQVCTLAGRRLSWDPTGPRLLTGSAEGDVSIWALPSGARLRHLRELGEQVNRVAFSPSGELVVAASEDGAVQVWDATSGKLRSQGNYLHGKIRSIEFDRASTLVVMAGANGSVAVADAALGMPVTVLDGPRNDITVAHFDPSARRVITASWGGTARVWDATAPYRRWSSPPISNDCGVASSLEPDRRFIAVGCIDHPTRIWDTARGQLLAELPSVTQVDGDFASAFPAVSAAGDRAAIARANTVEVYELPGGRLLRTIAHGAAVNAVAFASDGRDLVSGAVDGSLLVTRDSGAQLALPISSGGIDAAGFLPDGRVVAADAQRRLRVYDPRGAVLADFEMSARVRTLRMSLDSRRLITVPSPTGKATSPELWDFEHYVPIAQLQDQGRAYSARFVAGGQIVTACSDGAARLWDAATGQLRQTYHGGSRFLVDVELSPDGSMIVAGGGDGLLRFWDAASGRPLWTMPAHKSYLVGIRVEGQDIVTRGFSGDISRWTLPQSEQVIEACHRRAACDIVSR
jgi:WD40 repeat protein/serine/threonine protein kinase